MILIFGGYGTFGSLVARALEDLPLVIAGRDLRRADSFAQTLPSAASAAVDVRDISAVERLLARARVVVNCAGPFSGFDLSLVDACRKARVPYVDIADDRNYCRALRAQAPAFVADGAVAAFGCSSVPGISGALALGPTRPIKSAHVVLFIGNRNPKGHAAVSSALSVVGREIAAPQGAIVGFGDAETVELPAPFGRGTVVNFDSPEYDLLPELLGVSTVTVKVGFEFPIAHSVFRTLSKLGPLRPAALRASETLGRLTKFWGHSGGVVQVDLVHTDGTRTRRSCSTESDGQKMAALPCAWAVRALLDESAPPPSGVWTAYELLGSGLIDRLRQAGFRVALA